MKIKIMKDAHLHYHRTTPNFMPINYKWATAMELISGEVLEVETDYLFNDQFNTAGLSKSEIDRLIMKYHEKHGKTWRTADLENVKESLKMGLRIMESFVNEVIDDIRPNYIKCRWCGQQTRKPAEVCGSCEKSDYLEDLKSIHAFRYDKQD